MAKHPVGESLKSCQMSRGGNGMGVNEGGGAAGTQFTVKIKSVTLADDKLYINNSYVGYSL